MKRYRIAATLALGVLFPATSAVAWWQWFHQDVPNGPKPGIWFYQNIPTMTAPGQIQPWFWHYQSVPTGPTTIWSSPMPMDSLFVEQSHSPQGVTIRVRSGYPGTQEINVGVEGHILVIKKRQIAQIEPGARMQIPHSGWSTQWMSLPADANVAALRISRGDGLVEIFVPRVR